MLDFSVPRQFACVGLILGITLSPCFADDAGLEFFERKIRPVLVEKCYACHSAKAAADGELKGSLRLDTRQALLVGGDSGPAIVPKKPDESPLIEALDYTTYEMPPSGPLGEQVVSDFRKWIEMGAPDPRDGGKVDPVAKNEINFDAAREFWSFQPPTRHTEPVVQHKSWIERPIDAFVLRRMEDAGLSPSDTAERRTWLRRVTFDLTGLPPSPQDVERFLKDHSADAKSRVVERLLASPQYGEHWAKMWLDLMRYAEDQAHIVGNNRSLCYPNAYLYRDWVIEALNDDVPYDRFIKLQLAADLLEPDDDRNHVALGFIGLGPKYYRRNSLEVMADEWEDRVDVVGRGLLGLTVACARCHDHKYDPIETEDYYALAGVFASTRMLNRPLKNAKKSEKSKQAKSPDDSMHIIADAPTKDLNVFIRGDVKKKGPTVPRRFLQILDPEAKPFASQSGRLELAEAIADPNNPLTARVIVNRIWARHFGTPIVDTPSNFGKLGSEPSHPQLLDDLATRFVEHGWSLKWLHREITLSATYGQSSLGTEKSLEVDPANVYLSRMPRQRLSIEQWRDAILSISGKLEPQVGGTSIDPQDPTAARRTVYSEISRLELNSMLALFGHPDPNTHSERRIQTTTPLQKLFVLNSPFMVAQAEAFAQRLIDNRKDLDSQLDLAYRLCFNRLPHEAERSLAKQFLQSDEDDAVGRWTQYAQILFASNELQFVD
ncbi:PSD1 and planctomycete cytochrome C domain-containing protein [Thalassoroseus pseudoceratinae]|uniref:PSD1 and planctomycete cytochrome C domain-containing protein n=1 Tax=Thalassoroseus pseudoceratinae TaxID=2713176 RepID=UPI00141F7CA4|nr:PSD1 and planctomycete cytochrome C domain-containing protein [Thalassoroseus pseudoceratinae]